MHFKRPIVRVLVSHLYARIAVRQPKFPPSFTVRDVIQLLLNRYHRLDWVFKLLLKVIEIISATRVNYYGNVFLSFRARFDALLVSIRQLLSEVQTSASLSGVF